MENKSKENGEENTSVLNKTESYSQKFAEFLKSETQDFPFTEKDCIVIENGVLKKKIFIESLTEVPKKPVYKKEASAKTVKSWIKDHPEFTYIQDKSQIMCRICKIMVVANQKSTVMRHLMNKKHIALSNVVQRMAEFKKEKYNKIEDPDPRIENLNENSENSADSNPNELCETQMEKDRREAYAKTVESWIKDYPEFLYHRDKNRIMCHTCNLMLLSKDKSVINKHLKNKKHIALSNDALSDTDIQKEFNLYLAKIMLNSKISWNDLNNSIFRQFIEDCKDGKFSSANIPGETTIRKNYFPKIEQQDS